ncbi:MAG: endonuclease/exonuclease/phosphatase family protein [Pedobacter sp.]|nr:endonuclease/exonuclease/phosphatase family protein [Pedobacter sp.]MDQ8053584.1 endonuclease/exonuclease/phosphatase family protein [Pedobacter sp.]
MKKNKSTFFDKLLLLFAVLAGIGLLAGMVAADKNPVQHILYAFFGLAYPFFLLANLIFLLWWLLRKKWVHAIVTIVVIGVGYHTLIATFGWFGDSGQDEKANGQLMRLMTYNVHNFKPYGAEITPEVKQKMFDVVQNQHPDVVCFQEFFTRFKGQYDTVDSLKKILGTPYYYFHPVLKSASEAIGMAIFSKYPFENSGTIIFDNSLGNASIYTDIRLNGQLIRVYNIHLQSISFDKEDYVYIDKVKGMDPQMNSTKRILKMLKSAFQKRSTQVEQMRAHMQSCKTPYVICGDFNDTPASYAVNKMTDSLKNAFIEKGQGLGRTYNGKFPNFQIDYIATTKDFDVMNYRIVEAKLSDHFPVRSDLRLRSAN